MRTVRVLQKLLGIERARVVGVRFDEDDRGHVMVATLELHKNARSRCPQCKKRCPGYDQPPAPRLWRHLDMGFSEAYLISEWQKAQREEFTPMCFDQCRRCGVCGEVQA